MPSLNFRFKLLLAMLFAVAGVSGTTLFITQKKVQAAYERVFKEKIEAQITYLPKEQEARLAAVKEKCQDLVKKNVRLVAALREGDADTIYRVAYDELRRIFAADGRIGAFDPAEPPPVARPQPEAARPFDPRRKIPAVAGRVEEMKKKSGSKGSPPPSRPRFATVLAFLDSDGKVLADPAWAQSGKAGDERFTTIMSKVGSVIGSLTNQQVGYFELKPENRPNFLLEVIATPVVDEVESRTAGALVLGFPFADLGEATINAVTDLQNGIYIGGLIYSHTIPNAARAELARLLLEEIQAHPDPRDDCILTLDRIPHRVFYTPLNPGSPFGPAWKVGLYSWEGALRAQRELRTQILGFGAFALVAALLLSLLLSHSLSVPINELVGGTAHIRAGDFGIKVPVRSSDEIGQLARSFNEMAEGLALKEKYHDVLVKVTDKDVAAQLLSGEVLLGGELREVSVLFCDIRGFTAMTQNMGPAEVIAMLNDHMTAMTGIVNEHHGVVDKFIGDSVMALFGAPKSYGDDALNAVRCAAAMQRERAALNEIVPRKLHLGIGIATGPVLAGNMGSENRSNYTVIGERVNLASRLCGAAGRGEVVISQPTRDLLGGRVVVEEKDQLRLKGFDASVTAYRLVEVREAPEPVMKGAAVKA